VPLDVIVRYHQSGARASLNATGDRLLLSLVAILVFAALALFWRAAVFRKG
jgi:hypothetical protein